ncbi:glycosyltransferase [Vagococcus hydrophili]|uniref:Glycosyltransferase n=1 Tax=Vagococcus hydrophili TaxID=2714947 RepID=A0A6G8AR06_9ENTE|nr:glycosyltransferase [Vagococcus hydrophili]QIL47427.1 glycosyltransferase [Vagococcus hydrophili]
MGKKLILLTNYYPYYKGEEYLESEIKHLSNTFEKIIIIPTMINEKMKVTRSTPKNVDIIEINYHHTTISKLKNTVKRYKGEDVEQTTKQFKCLLYQNYFSNRCEAVFKLISQKLFSQKNDFIVDNMEVVIYSYWLYTTSQIGVLLKRELIDKHNISVKLISRAHRYDLYENETRLNFLPSRKFLLKNNDYIYPCSDDGAEYLTSKYPKYSDKIMSRKLGTSYKGTNIFTNEIPFEIVSCSALRPIKRINLIVEALEILESKNIKYHWTHFGDGEELENVSKLAQLKLNKRNYKFKGFVKNSEVIKFYKENSVGCFINVSASEGIPVSIMEALSFSIPVIATDVGGTREIVFNGENGTLLKKETGKKEISEEIMKIISSNIQEYNKMRDKSYYIWKSMYNSEILYKDFSLEVLEMKGEKN